MVKSICNNQEFQEFLFLRLECIRLVTIILRPGLRLFIFKQVLNSFFRLFRQATSIWEDISAVWGDVGENLAVQETRQVLGVAGPLPEQRRRWSSKFSRTLLCNLFVGLVTCNSLALITPFHSRKSARIWAGGHGSYRVTVNTLQRWGGHELATSRLRSHPGGLGRCAVLGKALGGFHWVGILCLVRLFQSRVFLPAVSISYAATPALEEGSLVQVRGSSTAPVTLTNVPWKQLFMRVA